MALSHRRDNAGDDHGHGKARRVDPEQAAGAALHSADAFQALGDVLKRWRGCRDQYGARLGQRDAAGGTRKQRLPDALFHQPDGMTHCRWAHAEFGRGRRKAVAAGDRKAHR